MPRRATLHNPSLRAVLLCLAAASAAACDAAAPADVAGTHRQASPLRLAVVPDTPVVATVGDTLRLAAVAIDRDGNAVPLATASWHSLTPDVAAVNDAGLVVGIGSGTAIIQVTSGALADTARLEVRADAAPPAVLAVAAIAPDTLRPGTTITVSGSGFGADATVSVGGVPATVTRVAADHIEATLSNAYPCAPTRQVAVLVGSGGRSAASTAPLAAANPRDLAVGESFTATDVASLRCTALAAGGKYVIAVYNAATRASDATSFRLQGVGAAGPGAQRQSLSIVGGRAPSVEATAAASVGGAASDAGVLVENARIAPQARRLATASRARMSRVASASARIGDVSSLRVPVLGNACTDYTPVQARTVYSGTRVVIYEDVAARLGGAADSSYQRIGRDLEGRQWDILTRDFGDPLAYDAQLQGDGRIRVLFTPRVNQDGLAGFMSSADLGSGCVSGNHAEMVYLAVMDPSHAALWRRTIGATTIHEVKHLAAYAEKLAHGGAFEEPWLEESMAMVAQELWSRQLYGHRQRGDTRFAALECSIGYSYRCAPNAPAPFNSHVLRQQEYLEAIETHTPLGPVDSGDWSYYGSGWSLVRWAADQSDQDEASFLSALTQDAARTGIANLEAHSGQSFQEMLGRFLLALAVDDRPGFSPRDPRLQFPSYDLPDIWAGLAAIGPAYSAHPLALRALAPGSFSVDVAGLRGGTGSIFELNGSASDAQLIGLLGPGGAAPAASLGMAVVRVE